MIKPLKPILTFCFTLFCGLLLAQNYYTIQLGTYRSAAIEDFNAVKSYGYVHANVLVDETKQVHICGFVSKAMAQRVLAKAKAKGFKNAFISTKPLKNGKMVSVIQLGTFTLGQKIPWAKYLNMGRIHTVVDGTKVKITSGVFADEATARERLIAAKSRGFDDAFVKTLNSQYLHAVNTFTTRGLEPMAMVEMITTPNTYTAPTAAPTYAYNDFTPKGAAVPQSYDNYNTNTYRAAKPQIFEVRKVKSYMPTISYKQKKNAIKWLQEVLQQTGVYSSKISNYYNAQTAAAYEAAKTKNYQLARFASQKNSETHGDFRDWKDIQLLLAIANSLTPYGERPSDETIKYMFAKPETLDINELQLIVSWDYRLRRGLKDWANADTLRGEMARAIKIAYFQAQIRLENYYKSKGYKTDQAKGLALTTLHTLAGKQLARFDNY